MSSAYVLALLLGHLWGDYLLQNQWMALNKSRVRSPWPGLTHAVIYTLAVMTATWDWRASWALVIFISHWPIDRLGLADKWLTFINGRTIKGFYYHGHEDIPIPPEAGQIGPGGRPHAPFSQWMDNYRILRGSFHALVYTAVDNTMHITLMTAGWYILKLWGR